MVAAGDFVMCRFTAQIDGWERVGGVCGVQQQGMMHCRFDRLNNKLVAAEMVFDVLGLVQQLQVCPCSLPMCLSHFTLCGSEVLRIEPLRRRCGCQPAREADGLSVQQHRGMSSYFWSVFLSTSQQCCRLWPLWTASRCASQGQMTRGDCSPKDSTANWSGILLCVLKTPINIVFNAIHRAVRSSRCSESSGPTSSRLSC